MQVDLVRPEWSVPSDMPIIVDFQRGPEDAPVWTLRWWFAHEHDSFPSAILATFNARAAIKDQDFTKWRERKDGSDA